MLTWIRKKSSGLFMTIVMGVLILAFALWGVGDYFTQSSNDSIATVNGENITYSQFNQKVAENRQTMLSQYGDGIDPSFFDSPQIRRSVLERMINSALIRQVAQSNGYRVTAEEIKNTIEEAPAFQDENGQFDKTLYAAFLAQTNQSAHTLQQKIAEQQATQVITGMVDQSGFVSPAEALRIASLNKQTRSIEYVTVAADKFKTDMVATDEEIEEYYQSNSTQYMTQEMISVNYIELNAEDVAKEIDVSEEAASTYYEKNKESYKKPEQRLASHILINDGDAAESTVEEIQAKLAAGEDFAELAETYSQDPGSASMGGDLGWVSPDDMVEAFNDALFAMAVNTVSEPIETEFGFHLIQLNEIKPAGTEAFEVVKADIIQALQAVDSETLFLEQAKVIEEAVLDAQSGLEAAATASGQELKTTELFSRSGGEDLAANPDFIQAAFSTSVKDELQNSGVIQISDTHVAFVHLNDQKPAELKPLEAVRDSIVTVLTDQKAQTAAKTLADSMAEKVKSGEQELTDLATENDLEVQTNEAVARTGSVLPFNLAKDVFALSRPAADQTNVHVLKGNGNDAVVLKLLAVDEPEFDETTDTAAETIQLTRNVKSNEQQLMIQALRESADVTINEQLLEQINNL